MRGISSVYGFIMIFLLSMASIQTWSTAVGSMESIQGASDQSHQLEQLQGIEHLSLTLYAGNLTIVNNGQVPSTVEFLRLADSNSSRTSALNVQLEVGARLSETVPVGYGVAAVTSLGNIFAAPQDPDPPGSVWLGSLGVPGSRNVQLFENAYSGSEFFLSAGSQVFAFSKSGSVVWTFDAGSGTVTDVIQITTGQVYVSVGYATTSNSAVLYELDSAGGLVASFPVRLLASPPGQTASLEQPVAKGGDSGYAYYDGWFYDGSGSIGSISSDANPLAATDPTNFYFYATYGAPYVDGVCQLWGNSMVFYSYTAGAVFAGGFKENWDDYVYLGSCNSFPQQLLGSSTGGGVLAALFADPYYSDNQFSTYPGQNPYIVAISDSGQTLFQGDAPSAGASAIATDGTNVFLAVPSTHEVQVIQIATGFVSTYKVGFAATGLVWTQGALFALSNSKVEVFDSSMTLQKTIDLAPLTLASSSNPLTFETALQAPSFIVLNGTSYAAVAENSTGYASLIIGDYA